MSSRLDYASSRLVTPGEIITRETGFMRCVYFHHNETIFVDAHVIVDNSASGHGTYSDGDDKLIASVAGVVERVNKLICVRPFKTR